MRSRASVLSIILLIVLVMSGLSACAPETAAPEAEVVEVEKVVKETVVVEKEVEKVVTATPEPRGKTRITIADSRDLQILDPQKMQATVDEFIWLSVFSGFTKLDPTMADPRPDMAESWELVDDTTYVFNLRKDVKWHSGRPFTAADVLYSWERAKEIGSAGRVTGYMSDVESMEALDDYTVQVNLKAPSAVFLLYTPFFVFVDEETIDQIETHPIGTGAYKFVEWIPNDHAIIAHNEDYWDTSIAYPDELYFMPIVEEQTRLAAIQTGEIDIAGNISPKLMTELAGMPGVTAFTPQVTASYAVVNMNVTQPPFDNKALRQAVAAAIDRDTIWRSVYFSNGVPSCNPIPDSSWAYDPEQECGPRDVEKAKAILAEAGIQTPIDITMKIFSDDLKVKEAQIIQANLAEIGINLELKVDDFAVWLEDVWVNKNFEMCSTNYTREADPDGLMSSVYRKDLGNNPMGYYNPEVDDLFDQAKAVYDRDERAKLYQKIIDIVLDDAPLVKIKSNFVIWAARDTVKGVTVLPRGFVMFPDLYVD